MCFNNGKLLTCYASLGYEGVPTFFDDLLTHLTGILQGHAPPRANGVSQLPCGMLGNESVGWVMDSEVIKKSPHQTLNSCNAELASTFQQHRCSPLAAHAPSP